MSKHLFLIAGVRSVFFVSVCLFLSFSIFIAPVIAIESENIDIDNDGLANDIEEALGSEPYLADTDGDGINDKDEVHDVMNPRDSDQDGRLDVLDLDDDNDGIPSVIEGIKDIDNDNIPNYLDDDSDGDELSDSDEVSLSYRDADKDYVDDVFDADITKRTDENGDGIIDDFVLFDSDKDGIADVWDDDGQTSIVSKKPLTTEIPAKKVAPKIPPQVQQAQSKLDNKADLKKISNNINQIVKASQETDAKAKIKSKAEVYGGSGFFYCANSGKIIAGITRFMITPSHRVALIKDAREGAYQWRAEEKGVYVLQFNLPVGVRVVDGLAKGRIILKESDESPLVLGQSESASKKGYLGNVGKANNPADNIQPWYNSFEMKQGAPLFVNNNIPLQGDLCEQ